MAVTRQCQCHDCHCHTPLGVAVDSSQFMSEAASRGDTDKNSRLFMGAFSTFATRGMSSTCFVNATRATHLDQRERKRMTHLLPIALIIVPGCQMPFDKVHTTALAGMLFLVAALAVWAAGDKDGDDQ